MKQLLIDGIIHCSWTGPTPDWAKDAEKKALAGDDGYTLQTVAHGDYIEGDSASDWDTATGKRITPRIVPPPVLTEAQIAANELHTLGAYLATTDWYAVRYAETGAAIPEDVKTARANARERISELREAGWTTSVI